MTRTLPLVVLLFLLSAAPGMPSAEGAEPTVGQLHPEIRLPTIDGKQNVSLRALVGKKVLLIQFASW